MKLPNFFRKIGGIFTLSLIILSFLVVASHATSSYSELWVATYGDSGDDIVSDIIVDVAGNVYITGRRGYIIGSGSSYATIKYDTYGNMQWERLYNGGSSWDVPIGIALDSAGNVYVTGRSYGSNTGNDYATIKYDNDGNEQWVARYNGPSVYMTDRAADIAVDAAGNVYVTGESDDLETRKDYATIKYDTNGNELWVARYNGGSYDGATGIDVDAAGNVYVTGRSVGSYPTNYNDNYATIKYDTNGNELWVAIYNGPENGNDSTYDIAVDSASNVYVTGGSNDFTGKDYATIKYDTNGNELWVARYNGPGNGYDVATDIAVDPAGNVYITGESYSSFLSGYDYATVKYDNDGNEQWVARYDGPGYISDDKPYAIVVGVTGNVYVTGQSEGVATIKYDTNGNEKWVARYAGLLGKDRGYNIAIDVTENVYVAGITWVSSNNYDFATRKYNEIDDTDYDGIPDIDDNCPNEQNVDQADIDVDGIGDICDGCPFDPLNDDDADGVCGDVDVCTDSDISENVFVNGCDSGVENTLFDDGCNILDLISNCALGTDKHGKFRSCVSKLGDYLQKEGVITPSEKDRILSCTARKNNN